MDWKIIQEILLYLNKKWLFERSSALYFLSKAKNPDAINEMFRLHSMGKQVLFRQPLLIVIPD